MKTARVIGAAGHVTRALLAGWLSSRLGVEVEQVDAEGTGLSRVELELEGTSISISRGRGTTAVLTRTDQPDRTLPLPRRDLGELLAEELEAATGTSGLSDRSPHRTHEWHDPVESDDPDPALSMS